MKKRILIIDDDKINTLEMQILDNEKIAPLQRLPFAYEISPLRLKIE